MRTPLYAALLFSLLFACTTTTETLVCPPGQIQNIFSKTCVPDPSAADAGTTTSASADTGGDDGGVTTGGTTGSNTGGTGQAGEDAKLPPPDPVKACDTPGFKKIGNPCTSNEECASCNCYDGAYMAPFRFCTQDCTAGKGSECPINPAAEFAEYACVIFTTGLIKSYDLELDSLCMPVCGSVDECKIYATEYNHCPDGSTLWDDVTVQALSTCQTSPQ